MNTICPHCQKVQDAAFPMSDKTRPADGDISFCGFCGEWAMFMQDQPGGLRKLTGEEWAELQQHVNILAVTTAWKLAKVVDDWRREIKEGNDEDRTG